MSKNKFGMMIYVVHTRAASKKDKGRWDVYEEVYIKNGFKSTLATSSSIILDCANMTVYKDRTGTAEPRSFDDFINYLAKSHQQVAEYKAMYDQYKKAIESLENQKVNVDVQGAESDKSDTE